MLAKCTLTGHPALAAEVNFPAADSWGEEISVRLLNNANSQKQFLEGKQPFIGEEGCILLFLPVRLASARVNLIQTFNLK